MKIIIFVEGGVVDAVISDGVPGEATEVKVVDYGIHDLPPYSVSIRELEYAPARVAQVWHRTEAEWAVKRARFPRLDFKEV